MVSGKLETITSKLKHRNLLPCPWDKHWNYRSLFHSCWRNCTMMWYYQTTQSSYSFELHVILCCLICNLYGANLQSIVFIAIWLWPANEFFQSFIQRGKNDAAPVLRSLKLEDFTQSKAKVRNFADLSHLYTLSFCKYTLLNFGIHDLFRRLALLLLMMLQAWMSWENGMNSMERGEAGKNHLSDFEANTTVFFFF